MNSLLKSGTAAIVPLCLLTSVNASDINIGPRGPTTFQIDVRGIYSERDDVNGNRSTTIANTDVLKYWTGDKLGLFGFISSGYKSVDSPKVNNNGPTDTIIVDGLRGRADFGDRGNFHWITYGGASLPTGDEKAKPALGNGRFDLKFGTFDTWLSPNKYFELDSSFEYTLAGEDKKGNKGPDEIFAGLIAGGRINDRFRAAAGFTVKLKENLSEKDWDYVLGPRAVIRYTPKKGNWHIEELFDYDAARGKRNNLPAGFQLTTQLRYNF